MTNGADDKNAVAIALALEGLSGDKNKLRSRIRQMVETYHATEEAARSRFNRVGEEIEALEEMAEALKFAQRKMRAAPQPLRVGIEWDTPGKWRATVSEFDRVVTPILAAVVETQKHMAEYRQGPGNPAATKNRDILLATIQRWLRTADASDHAKRTQRILQIYDVPCPTGGKAFAQAAKRGEKLLDGPAAEGSLDWTRARIAEKGR